MAETHRSALAFKSGDADLNSLEKLGFSLISQLKNIPEMPERPFFLMKLDL
jgi:hypothetical protein